MPATRWPRSTSNPGAALEPYVQDALDEIEYVTGGADTKWGAERARTGIQRPSRCTTSRSATRTGSTVRAPTTAASRSSSSHQAALSGLQLIATAPIKSVKPDVLDEHFYMSG
jgi:alpha-N-arabinofuranosidase